MMAEKETIQNVLGQLKAFMKTFKEDYIEKLNDLKVSPAASNFTNY